MEGFLFTVPSLGSNVETSSHYREIEKAVFPESPSSDTLSAAQMMKSISS
jgi:hypothetical protein